MRINEKDLQHFTRVSENQADKASLNVHDLYESRTYRFEFTQSVLAWNESSHYHKRKGKTTYLQLPGDLPPECVLRCSPKHHLTRDGCLKKKNEPSRDHKSYALAILSVLLEATRYDEARGQIALALCMHAGPVDHNLQVAILPAHHRPTGNHIEMSELHSIPPMKQYPLVSE